MDDYVRFTFKDRFMTFIGRASGVCDPNSGKHYDVLSFEAENGNIYKYMAQVDKRGCDMTLFGKCCTAADIGKKYVISGAARLVSLPFDEYDTDVYEMYAPRTNTRFVAEA